MESIGEPTITKKMKEQIKELIKIFEPDENGKKVKKLQVIDGKLEVQYEGGE